MFKTLKPQEWTIFNFFQTSFFSTKCAPFLLKLGKDFNIDYLKEKGFIKKSYIYIYIYNLNTFGSNVFLTLNIMDFEKVSLTKFVHIYVIEGMNA